jgi:hypothetical protein
MRSMETCVGCGAMLAPSWKYCIHCGIAVDAREVTPGIPSAIRPVAPPARPGAVRNHALLIGGVGTGVIGVALLGLAVAYATGAFR